MKLPFRRAIAVAALCLSLAAPAHAVGPLAAVFIGYAKQMLTDKLVAYAKGKVSEVAGDAIGQVPGLGMVAAIAPGLFGGMAPRPTLPKEAKEALERSGVFDRNAQPLSDAEWQQFEQVMATMASAAGPGAEVPDLAAMRASLKEHPELAGMIRASFGQVQAIRTEQERMEQLYEEMPQDQRQEVVDSLVQSLRETPAAERPQLTRVLESDALGWPDELKERVLAALDR